MAVLIGRDARCEVRSSREATRRTNAQTETLTEPSSCKREGRDTTVPGERPGEGRLGGAVLGVSSRGQF